MFGKLPEKKANTGLVFYKAFIDSSPHLFLGNGHAVFVVHSFHWIPAPLNTSSIEHFSLHHVASSVTLTSLMSDLTSDTDLGNNSFHSMKSFVCAYKRQLYFFMLAVLYCLLHPLELELVL